MIDLKQTRGEINKQISQMSSEQLTRELNRLSKQVNQRLLRTTRDVGRTDEVSAFEKIAVRQGRTTDKEGQRFRHLDEKIGNKLQSREQKENMLHDYMDVLKGGTYSNLTKLGRRQIQRKLTRESFKEDEKGSFKKAMKNLGQDFSFSQMNKYLKLKKSRFFKKIWSDIYSYKLFSLFMTKKGGKNFKVTDFEKEFKKEFGNVLPSTSEFTDFFEYYLDKQEIKDKNYSFQTWKEEH